MFDRNRLIAALSLPLIAGAAVPIASTLFAEPSPSSLVRVDGYEALVEEYKTALAEHRSKIRASESREERRVLRKSHPAQAFAERFETLAASGTNEAYLWLIERAKDRGVERKELYAEKARLYQLFLNATPSGEVLVEGVDQLLGDSTFRRGDGPKEVDRLFALALEKAQSDEVRVTLQIMSGMRLAKSKDEAAQERGLVLLRQLAEKYPGHERMERVKKELFALEHLMIGRIAPEFEGQRIDGTPIKLSDFRGKVVVLDFFGFW